MLEVDMTERQFLYLGSKFHYCLVWDGYNIDILSWFQSHKYVSMLKMEASCPNHHLQDSVIQRTDMLLCDSESFPLRLRRT